MFNRRRFKARRSGNSAAASNSTSSKGGMYQDYDSQYNNNNNGGVINTSSLANFDACVEACDAIAASSGGAIGRIGSPRKTDLSDGLSSPGGGGANNSDYGSRSIMISPDGELISCSNHGYESNVHEDNSEKYASDTDESAGNNIQGDGKHGEGVTIGEIDTNSSSINGSPKKDKTNSDSQHKREAREDEIDSSIYIGNDVVLNGEKIVNGFSARGWNPVMTTIAIRRAVDTLQTTSKFVEELIVSNKNSAANASQACEQLRGMMIIEEENEKSKENLVPPAPSDLSTASGQKSGAGPLLFPGSTLHEALLAMEQYNSKIADSESHRWRVASNNSSNADGGVLPSIQNGTMKNYFRAERRERALMASQELLAEAESNLRARKDDSRKLWAKVYKVEDLVNRKVEEKLRQRSRERELRRRQEESERQAAMTDAKLPSTVTQQEIWELVAQVGKDNDGSFAPHDLPPPNVDGPLDQSLSQSKSFDSTVKSAQSKELPPPAPIDDYRAELEEEYRLHELRVAAVESDENVTDAAGKLLNTISACDTTNRSARIAAETCLLSCANTQLKCLKSLVALERASLNEKLKLIDELEEKIDNVDVRSDLNIFIEHEKVEIPNGASSLGDNDDGGIASALATLNSFSEGIGVGVGVAGMAELSSFSGWNDENKDEKIFERDDLEAAVGVLFQGELYSINEETDTAKHEENMDILEEKITFLESAVSEKSLRGRGYRASTCYALNNYRGKNTQLECKEQFDGLCRVLNSLLDGCDREAADVANAKMCMMLAQTFYYINSDDKSNSQDRTNRRYPKEKLCHHAIWSDEDFWTQALFQCVTDSLANSGINIRVRVKKSERNRKMKWHDLNYQDRAEAATQIHSVIFSQLGALGHSMMEFGCSVDQACAFVRRLSVRHQLPLSKRSMLLSHLMNGADDATKEGIDVGCSK